MKKKNISSAQAKTIHFRNRAQIHGIPVRLRLQVADQSQFMGKEECGQLSAPMKAYRPCEKKKKKKESFAIDEKECFLFFLFSSVLVTCL
ncbi:hypothetical protein CEXT_388961 [Caerostris extrusa]|uniref:Uncharacterized protein n=1 Tax=Caerostris extrusa TaxID=172846 RepID=A0AAV4VI06_CAEEX|nr:hypothetical protein CEXT_388961 [Caerostris extrusa]